MAIIFTIGTPVYLTDVSAALVSFSEKYSEKYKITYNALNFKKSLKELENSFIKISKDSSDNLIIEYQNPSIQDFLTNYLGDQLEILEDVISTAIFISQFFNLFKPTLYNTTPLLSFGNSFKVFNDQAIKNKLSSSIVDSYDSLSRIKLVKHMTGEGKILWHRSKHSEVAVLRLIYDEYKLKMEEPMKSFIKSRFQQLLYPSSLSSIDISHYTYLFDNLKDDVTYNGGDIIESLFKSVHWFSDFKIFSKMKSILPNAFANFVETDSRFRIKLDEVFKSEKVSASSTNIDYTLTDIEYVEKEYKVDLSENKRELKDIKAIGEAENSVNWENEESEIQEPVTDDVDAEIINLFSSFSDL